jgi:hypothetical protein
MFSQRRALSIIFLLCLSSYFQIKSFLENWQGIGHEFLQFPPFFRAPKEGGPVDRPRRPVRM